MSSLRLFEGMNKLNNRIINLIKRMEASGIDNILITDPKNMHYYSGFYNGEGYIVAGKSGFFVVTDSRYTEYATSVCEGFDVCDISSHKLTDFVPASQSLGFEDKSISYSQYVWASSAVKDVLPIGNMALELRQIKDSVELSCIERAAAIADGAFSYICSVMRPGMTEKQVAAEIDCYMKKNGADDIAFSTIAAAGERGSLPHAIPTDRPLKEGDLVVMDYGCIIDGYASDMTRTVAVGDVSEECEKIYYTVLEAQQKALSEIKSGKIACEIDKCARDIINVSYNGRFGHALGHSVGLDIHESPNLSPKNNKPLACGNVVTVEPGIYVPGLCGVRIEDLVAVTKDGIINFTKSDKELVIVK